MSNKEYEAYCAQRGMCSARTRQQEENGETNIHHRAISGTNRCQFHGGARQGSHYVPQSVREQIYREVIEDLKKKWKIEC